MPSRPILIFAISVLLLALVLAAGSFWLVPREQGSGKPLVGGPFTLTDHNGNRVTERSYPGKYLLIFFGYTYCPDVCPSELQVMSAALDQLGADAGRIQPLFVSIDPARDGFIALPLVIECLHEKAVPRRPRHHALAVIVAVARADITAAGLAKDAVRREVDHVVLRTLQLAHIMLITGYLVLNVFKIFPRGRLRGGAEAECESAIS